MNDFKSPALILTHSIDYKFILHEWNIANNNGIDWNSISQK